MRRDTRCQLHALLVCGMGVRPTHFTIITNLKQIVTRPYYVAVNSGPGVGRM